MANVTAVSQSVPQAVFCEKCVCWCRNEREYGTHVDGQRHRAPALTREVLFGLLFGNVGVDGSSDQHGAWYTSIDAFLSHRRLKARQAAPGHAKKRKTPASADPVLVLLFYKYTDPAISRDNVERLHQWQSKLGRALSMTGRVRVGTEGINGTVGGTHAAVALYKLAMHHHLEWGNENGLGTAFRTIVFKESALPDDATLEKKSPFANFWVRVCKEIVVLGCDPDGPVQAKYGGTHLAPEEFHEALVRHKSAPTVSGNDASTAPPKPILLDVRNLYESAIGAFEGATRLATRHFDEFPEVADQLIEEHGLRVTAGSAAETSPKVYMYCTGGIRCERASAYLISKGVPATNVFQLEGGIHKYIERYESTSSCLWRGRNFVFDRRVASARVGTAHPFGQCAGCKQTNVVDVYRSDVTCTECGVWTLLCDACYVAGEEIKAALVCEYCVKARKYSLARKMHN